MWNEEEEENSHGQFKEIESYMGVCGKKRRQRQVAFYLSSRQDLPTPESPISSSLKR